MTSRLLFHPVIFLVLNSCTPADPGAQAIQVIGHGGDGFPTWRNSQPPNTLEAIRHGYFLDKADAVEFDLQLTADSGIVLFHDDLLEKSSDCKGCISQMKVDEIKQCHTHGGVGNPSRGDRMCELREVLDLLKDTDAELYLNVKIHDPCVQHDLQQYREKFSAKIIESLADFGMEDRVFVETLDTAFLGICKRLNPMVRVIYDDEDPGRALQVCIEKEFEGYAVSNRQISAVDVLNGKAEGKRVIIWGVKTLQDSKDAVSKHPDGIMTDDILMLRNLVR